MSSAANDQSAKPRQPRVLLHACCGPCSLEPTRIFAKEGLDFSIHFYNPNIYPRKEYERRLSTLEEHVAGPQGIELIEGDYNPELWERKVAPCGNDRSARCRACYALRLEETARQAKERGFDAIATTLTISPYQFTRTILDELDRAAKRHGLSAICRDFREYYPQATQRSREKGMYRQNYCGCRFSIAEAAEQREAAKKQHEESQRMRHIALILASAEGAYNQANQL